jgi:GT2 family glycosyltransferase
MLPPSAKVLILTPVKDAAAYLAGYFANFEALTYPPELLSLGMLESDSADGTFAALEAPVRQLARRWRRAECWQRAFGYRLPAGLPRWTFSVQLMRRSILARSRNHLLFRALDDEDWVLWLDVDVVEYPADIVQRLLAIGRSIVHPNCVCVPGGPSFDQNARRGPGHRLLSDLRDEGEVVELDAVGGTMLLIRADLHRDGLIFPPFPYGRASPRARPDMPELETEGLACMAWDMGHRCWGLPRLEVRHAPR